MGTTYSCDPDPSDELLRRACAGDQHALAELFDRYRDRLRRMVRLRMDRRLRGRVDASDVLQEAQVEILRRAAAYAADPRLPPFLWIRFITGQAVTGVTGLAGGAAAGLLLGDGTQVPADVIVEATGSLACVEWLAGGAAGNDLEEFKEWDRDNEGFITPEEAIHAYAAMTHTPDPLVAANIEAAFACR